MSFSSIFSGPGGRIFPSGANYNSIITNMQLFYYPSIESVGFTSSIGTFHLHQVTPIVTSSPLPSSSYFSAPFFDVASQTEQYANLPRNLLVNRINFEAAGLHSADGPGTGAEGITLAEIEGKTIYQLIGAQSVLHINFGYQDPVNGNNIDLSQFSPSESFDLVLGDANDTVTGGTQYTVARLGGGNDTFTGGSGLEYVYGEDGNDTLISGPAHSEFLFDFLYGGADNDVLIGNETTFLIGGSGNDQFQEGIYFYEESLLGGVFVNLSDSQQTHAGATLAGRSAIDEYGEIDTFSTNVINGHASNYNDVVWMNSGYLFARSGNDLVIQTGLGGFVLLGPGDDRYVGWLGDESAFGEEGDDVFYYLGGNDLFDGGTNSPMGSAGAGDLVYLTGTSSDYEIDDTIGANTTTYTNTNTGDVVTLVDIERVSFVPNVSILGSADPSGGSDAIEGNSDDERNVLVFVVRIDEALDTSVFVDYEAVASNEENAATLGTDVDFEPGTVEIPAGQTQALIEVEIVGDFDPEKPEVLELQISNARTEDPSQFVSIGQNTAQTSILNDDPGITLQLPQGLQLPALLIEGESLPPLRIELEEPVDFDINLNFQIEGGLGSEQFLFSDLTIAPGGMFALPGLPYPFEDNSLKIDQEGKFLVTATDSNGDLLPISVGGLSFTEYEIDFLLRDRVLADLEPSDVAIGLEAAGTMLDSVSDLVDLLLEAGKIADPSNIDEYFPNVFNSDAFRNGLLNDAQNLVQRTATATGVVLGAATVAEILLNYNERLDAVDNTDDVGERSDALYEAHRALFVDIVDSSAAAAFSSGINISAAVAAGYAAGLLGVSVAALPIAVGVVGAVAIGTAAGLTYDGLFRQLVQASAANAFSSFISREQFDEWVQSPPNPNFEINSLTPGDDVETASNAPEVFLVGPGNDDIQGTLANLNDDLLLGFGDGDSITFLGQDFGQNAVTLSEGSTIIEIDVDGNGIADSKITLAGDDAPKVLYLSHSNGNTILRADANGVPISINDAPIANDDQYHVEEDCQRR